MSEYGAGFPVIVGEEITNGAYHMNAYPMTTLVPRGLTPMEAIKEAKDQGATIQWNHPGFPYPHWWFMPFFKNGIAGTGIDAWERVNTLNYDEWKAEGKLPPLTNGTDTHNAVFGNGDRTIIISTGRTPMDVATAVKTGNTLALASTGKNIFYGKDDLVSIVWRVLAEGNQLKDAKKQVLKSDLMNIDLVGLINASYPDKQ
jgi:hypothetical protein